MNRDVDFILFYSKNWYKAVKSDLTAEQKKEKVRQMREKNKRLNDVSQNTKQTQNHVFNSSMKGINPDERPIKSAANYNFDERPIAPASKSSDTQNQAEEGMMMTFEFSASNSKPTNNKILRKNGGLSNNKNKKNYEERKERITTENSNNEINTPKNKNFLKRGAGQVYDPLKAAKEAKKKKKEEIKLQKQQEEEKREILMEIERRKNAGEDISDLASVLYYDEDDAQNVVHGSNIEFTDYSQLRKGSKEESLQQSKKVAKPKLSTKTTNEQINNNKNPTPKVSNKFQNLGYLKKIPKRVDCWLPKKEKKHAQTPSARIKGDIPGKAENVDFSKNF